MTFLSITDLQCSRNNNILFSPISFSLKPGELMHICGLNGIGKTTLLKCLASFSKPYQGEINWQEKNIYENPDVYKEQLIFLGHNNAVKSSLTVRENLKWSLSINPSIADINSALEYLGMGNKKECLASLLSAGQKQRIALAKLYLSPAKIWILDEPFTSLDTQGLKLAQELINLHLMKGGMVILTSHLIFNAISYQALELKPFDDINGVIY